MDERIARLKSSKDARVFATNARRLEHLDLEAQALLRAHELQALEEGYVTPAEQAIAVALYNYEEQQSRELGRRFRASRTRQMLTKHGAIAAAERMVLSPEPSRGFSVLERAGLKEMTFEAIIDRLHEEFSIAAVEASRARLEGRPPPPLPAKVASSPLPPRRSSPPIVRMDEEVRTFVEGFKNTDAWFLTNWLPRYRISLQTIAAALAEDRPETAFDLIWRTVDNSISNLGQGVLKFELVDLMRDELTQVVREIANDGSPETFDRIVARFELWKSEERIPIVPRLLIARAFSSIHPKNYHTTVDARSQNQAITWFEAHTGFVPPDTSSWAARASALVAYLDQLNVFGDEFLLRNLFPWFVIDQLRGRTAGDIPPGHTPRADSAFADLPAQQRVIRLRHNAVQNALFEMLKTEFGHDRVWTELPTGTGGYADALARHPDNRCQLYEIKIGDTASSVVRQAMGQLLEYGFRSGGLEPVKLFAVGEPALDDVTRHFLKRLRADFNLEIDYLQVEVADPVPIS